MKDGEVCKVMVCKTKHGTYYVQKMPGDFGMGTRWVIMKDRRRYQWLNYTSEDAACAAMLEAVQRDVLRQMKLEL